jgi:hypothetical protein
MLKFKLLYIFIVNCSLFIVHCSLSAQVDVKDSIVFTPMLSAHYSAMLPGNDLAKRYGFNSNIGGSFMFKNKKNWLAGLDFNFLFGNIIKENNILQGITTKDGGIIAVDGTFAEVNEFERGFYINAKLGRLFPVIGPNPNSGILITGSVGLLQHKIRIDVANNNTPQLNADYKKGYDRLTNGLGISEFIGYMYLGNNRLISFYAGIELIQSWTQGRRDWQVDLMAPDHAKRHDTLYGLKFGWIIPLYQKASKSGYYYF